MNRKAMIEEVCSYILNQNHEWQDMLNDMSESLKSGDDREGVKQTGRNRIWYTATVLLHGKRHAEKGINEAWREVCK